MPKDLSFSCNWQAPDARPRISAAGISGKTAWIEVDYNGTIFSAAVSKSLVNQIRKETKRQLNRG